MDENKIKKSTTTDGNPPVEGYENSSAPSPINPETGQNESYWILTEEERNKGLVKPLRRSYIHDKCGVETKMGLALCETYARDPKYYGQTFCASCKVHLPISEFKWAEDNVTVGE